LKKSAQFLKNLNLFQPVPPSVDEHDIQNQRISTRVFIFLLTVSLTILLLYNSIIPIKTTNTIETPIIEQYEKLYSSHSQTLTCPCKTISIDYDKFINIKYTLHQVCTSMFVTQDWIDYLAHSAIDQEASPHDFRQSGIFTFQALNASCELVNRTISDSLIQFSLNQYVSPTVTPFELFQSQIKAFIRQFRSTTTNNFLRSLDMIRSTNQANALFSAISTNYEFYFRAAALVATTRPHSYSDCPCDASSICISPSSIYNYPDKKPAFSVPGMYRGCYIVEALLQSTLECFYDQLCLNQLQSYSTPSSVMNITSLDPSLSSEYSVNSTIQELLDELMIEEWNLSITYNNYYNVCQPIVCTYTSETKNGIVYIITVLLGLVGGLIIVLEFVVPRLMKFIRWIIRKCRRRIGPEISTIQT
jgi:hypothetical protein